MQKQGIFSVEASPSMQKYFTSLESDFHAQFDLSVQAHTKGLDPSTSVEITPAKDVAGRVEGLVGPKGVAGVIREIAKTSSREKTCFEIARRIISGEIPLTAEEKPETVEKEKLIEQATRTGLALFTEGVVSAPIEGVSKVRIKKNPDASDYLSIYFTGPIRGAGGTGQAFVLLLGDYCRKFFGIAEYRPLESEIERYKEEVSLYARKTRAGQYVPTDDEVEWVVKNCAVRIDGEPTEDYEVSVNRNVPSIETNKVRSGVCLVIGEGVCLKAAKVRKIASKNGLDWEWLQNLIKVTKQESKTVEIKPVDRFMEEIVAGRPIFSFPMRVGGFRLRYGRTRFMGILSKAIHPATMVLLDDFPVFGTQVKTERPAKGCVVTPCETIDGPIVLMDDESVKRIETVKQALQARGKIKQIIFLGDMLCCYGDFNKSTHPLVPSPWVEEWFALELKEKGVEKTRDELRSITFDEAKALAEKHSVPLAPRHTLFWGDIPLDEIEKLAAFIKNGKPEFEWFELKGLKLPLAPEKTILEHLGLEHKVENGEIVLSRDEALSLLLPLGALKEKTIDTVELEKALAQFREEIRATPLPAGTKPAIKLLNKISPFEIRDKGGIYIGTAMGRPEKSRERKMKPLVHSLFPIGFNGGKSRNLMKAYADLKATNPSASIELELRKCAGCGRKSWSRLCECGGKTEKAFRCPKCGKINGVAECPCGGKGEGFEQQEVNLVKIVDSAVKKLGFQPKEVKAVQGLISARKTPETIEKGLLRSKHGVSVFRDGTGRFDATEIPCTHFYPLEIGVSIEKLREIGYEKDAFGQELTDEMQLLELKPQDVIVSENCGKYMMQVAGFVDDLLVLQYGLPAYYNAKSPGDMVGKQCIALAPHTSAGIICRIIGFTPVQALLAHPYLHCATRRNCDGDELAIMLLMDGLLNFSKEFLPQTRGGQMDAPLVLTILLDPKEVDDEVHAMDRAFAYPLSFYQSTLSFASPSEVHIQTIGETLGKPEQYEGIGFTHPSAPVDSTIPVHSSYVALKTMHQKVEDELSLMMRIRAVDAQEAAEKIILSHFFPDLYGNLRSFSKQKFRCVECGVKYRRPPLSGKCRACGGKLLLTIHKAGIEKYLSVAKEMTERFDLPEYLKQRLMLIEREIKEVFREEKETQFSLAKFV